MKKILLLPSLLVLFLLGSAFKSSAPKAEYKVDIKKSQVKWTGYHLAKSYEHWGNVGIKSGSIKMEGDNIVGGEIIINMSNISNGDLKDEKKNAKLVKHLKSDDFFGVKKFPEAKLSIKSAKKSGNEYDIIADITIRGISKEVSFKASKKGMKFSSSFNVDRTLHKVMYGWKIENAVLSNEFKLDIDLVLKK